MDVLYPVTVMPEPGAVVPSIGNGERRGDRDGSRHIEHHAAAAGAECVPEGAGARIVEIRHVEDGAAAGGHGAVSLWRVNIAGSGWHGDFVDVTEVLSGAGELDRVRRVVVERDVHVHGHPGGPGAGRREGDGCGRAVDDQVDGARRGGAERVTDAQAFRAVAVAIDVVERHRAASGAKVDVARAAIAGMDRFVNRPRASNGGVFGLISAASGRRRERRISDGRPMSKGAACARQSHQG